MHISRRSILLGGSAVGLCTGVGAVVHALTGGGADPIVSVAGHSVALTTGLAVDAAMIESNGWVLRVTGAWPASTFASFDLSPDTGGKIVLDIESAGFETLNGWAGPTLRRRRIVATKPLRRSVAGPPVDLTSLDEAALGNGRREVRFALSDFVHQGDRVVGAAFLPGWRVDGGAGELSDVVNGSALTVELPSMRWATANLMQAGAGRDLRIDMLIASAHAVGRQAVAAVRFVASDGQATNSVWATRLSTSSARDRLRCWGVDVVASGLMNGLRAGLVTVHAEVFPHVGAMRATGSGHNLNRDAGFGYGAEVPLHICWDPNGARYGERHIFIDPVAGALTPAAVTIAASLDDARRGVAARTVSVALQALYLNNRTLPAANGFPGGGRAGDGAVLTLAAGRHVGYGAQAVTNGGATHEARIVIQGDPADPDPAVNCVLETAPSQPIIRFTMFHLRGFRLLAGTNTLANAAGYHHLDGLMIEGKPGQEANSIGPFSSFGWGATIRNSAAHCRWWRSGAGFFGTNGRFGLLRDVEFTRSITGVTMVGCRNLPDPTIGVTGTPGTGTLLRPLEIAGQPALAADQFIWGCRLRGTATRAFAFPIEAGLVTRFRLVNNLFERSWATSPEPFASLGEGSTVSARGCLLEGNTFVGERFNWAYNDPNTADLALQNHHLGNAVRNNYFDWLPTKHDQFVNPRVRRSRPGFTAGWAILYGVGYRDNVLGRRSSAGGLFRYEHDGLNTASNPVAGQTGVNYAGFADDRSAWSSSGSGPGFGEYRPAFGSPLLNRAEVACIDSEDAWLPGERFASGFASSRRA